MNVILGWLTMLENGDAGDQAATALTVIRRNADLQARLIDDLLDTNRLISGTMKLAMEPVDLEALMNGALEGLRLAADAKRVQVTSDMRCRAARVSGDVKRLQQVLWNLIHNAIKFTPSGGRVDVRLLEQAGHVRIEVHDTGKGIAPSFLPFLFERFRQEQEFSHRSVPGLGLGLAIAKDLVELHGGSIEASSPGAGQGSTFIVSLPSDAPVPQSSALMRTSLSAPTSL
jgi:signal transduction histidine kinase